MDGSEERKRRSVSPIVGPADEMIAQEFCCAAYVAYWQIVLQKSFCTGIQKF
jgi:hypothetical protein